MRSRRALSQLQSGAMDRDALSLVSVFFSWVIFDLLCFFVLAVE